MRTNGVFMFKKILFCVGFVSPFVQAQAGLETLKAKIQEKTALVDGNFALAFKHTSKPELFVSINEKELFHAASTIKTPVMMEVFKQAKTGKFKLADSVLVKNEFKSIVDGSRYQMNVSDDSGEEMYKKIGRRMTVYDLVYQMITVSSNLATNILIEMVGAGNATNYMGELGAKDIRVLRGVEDQKAFDKGWNNLVTAHDLLVIYEKLARGQVVDAQASKAMMEILLAQQYNQIIPARLPKEVKVAHKTGEITGVRHDSGIVYLPDGQQYVLVLLSKNLKNPDAGVKMLAEVSEMIYEFVRTNK
jgi:beta-lactamase class A